MKKIISITVFSCFVMSGGFAQQSTLFRKTIENNSRDDTEFMEKGYEMAIPNGSDKFDSKKDNDMLSEISMPGSNIFCLLHSKVRTDCEF